MARTADTPRALPPVENMSPTELLTYLPHDLPEPGHISAPDQAVGLRMDEAAVPVETEPVRCPAGCCDLDAAVRLRQAHDRQVRTLLRPVDSRQPFHDQGNVWSLRQGDITARVLARWLHDQPNLGHLVHCRERRSSTTPADGE